MKILHESKEKDILLSSLSPCILCFPQTGDLKDPGLRCTHAVNEHMTTPIHFNSGFGPTLYPVVYCMKAPKTD